MEPLEHAEHQTQIAPDKFLPRPHIPAVDEGKELPHPFVADDGERRGIHAADFNFADGHIVASLAFLNCIMTAVKEKYSRGAWLYLGEKRIDAKGGRNMTFSELKKKDMILIAAVLAISLISFAAIKMTQKDGKEVIVTVEGKEVYKTSIKKDQIYQIPEKNGTNVMQIKDGKVTMKKADCKDQICADHKAIEKSGETIVCLPHKVVIEIQSEDGKEQELDGVTQ